jgi:hypothetical protein
MTHTEALALCNYLECNDASMEAQCKAAAFIREALAQPEQKRPQNCGTGYCSCIECVMEPEQEPVATVISETGNADVSMSWWHEPALPVGTKLYTIPSQRTWVGLTKEEIAEFATWLDDREEEVGWVAPSEIVAYIEAKLKEKNQH